MRIIFKITLGKDYLYLDTDNLRLEYKKLCRMSKTSKAWYGTPTINGVKHNVNMYQKTYQGAYKKSQIFPCTVGQEQAGILKQMHLFAAGSLKFGDFHFKVVVTNDEGTPHKWLWVLNRRMDRAKMMLDTSEIAELLVGSALSVEDVVMAGEEFDIELSECEVENGEGNEFERSMEVTRHDEESARLKGRRNTELDPDVD